MNLQDRPPLLPSPWIDPDRMALASAFGATQVNVAVWPASNRAIYTPAFFPCRVVVLGVNFVCSTALGNYDLGVYDPDLNLIEAKGTTAVVAGINTLTLTSPLRVEAGRALQAGLVMSSGSDTPLRSAPASALACSYIGLTQEALAGTSLPSTGTPASPASAYMPILSWNLRR